MYDDDGDIKRRQKQKSKGKGKAYPTHTVHPAQSLTHTIALIHIGAKLCVVLVRI